MNIPLYHCATGRFILFPSKNDTVYELEDLSRQDLPPRTAYCILSIVIKFKNTDRSRPERSILKNCLIKNNDYASYDILLSKFMRVIIILRILGK